MSTFFTVQTGLRIINIRINRETTEANVLQLVNEKQNHNQKFKIFIFNRK